MVDFTPGFNLPGIGDVKRGISNVGNSLGSFAGSGQAVNSGQPVFTNRNISSPKPGGNVMGAGTSSPVQAPQQDPSQSGQYGGAGGAGGSGNDYSAELGQLGANESMLRDQLAKILSQATYNQGYQNIDNSYNSSRNKATGQQERALRDFNTQQDDTERGKDQAIGKVDTNARTLADSVRRMLGLASGSGSSAYQITAPDAVTRKASLERGDVQEDFGQNFRNIDTARKDTESDYESLLNELASQRASARQSFETGVGEQANSVRGQLHDIVTQRAAYQGGNAARVAAAGAPLRADINSSNAALDGLFAKYQTPVNARDLNVKDVSLRDYVVDRANIGGGGTQQNQGATAYADPFQQKKEDEQNPLY